MISAIIIIGISLKLAIILVLIRTSIGFSVMYQRLKQAICLSQSDPETNYLASGLIQEYEAGSMKFCSESVEETTLLEESEKAPATPSKAEGYFSLMKQKIDSKPSKTSDKRARKAQTAGRPSEVTVCSSHFEQQQPRLQAGSPVDVGSKASLFPAIDPTAPVSAHRVSVGSLDPKRQTADQRPSSEGVQPAPHLAPTFTRPKKPAKGPSRIRSKLAVKLEKKLGSLEASVSLASTLPRQEVLLHKLDKLIRHHSKKLAQAGRTELPVISEEEHVLSK